MRPAQRRSETYIFKRLPGCVGGGCHARVWMPDKRPSGDLRVSIAYHGGGWTFGDSVDVPDPDVEFLVSQGVIVVGLQYRLAPHVSYREILQDALDGYAWVWTDLSSVCGLDGKVEQVYLHGWSAGGHIAAMVGGHYAQRNLPKPSGLMLVYGALDVKRLFRPDVKDVHQSEEMKALQAELEAGPVEVGIPLNSIKGERGRWYNDAFNSGVLGRLLGGAPTCPTQYNPIDFLTSDFPPTCLLCARQDTTISPPTWDAFANRLQEFGVPYRQIWAEGMLHGRAENCEDEEAYAGWFRDCIRPGIQWTLGER